jgi:hypothetical protein
MFLPPTTAEAKTTSARERLAVAECLETDALKDAFARMCGIAQSAPK